MAIYGVFRSAEVFDLKKFVLSVLSNHEGTGMPLFANTFVFESLLRGYMRCILNFEPKD